MRKTGLLIVAVALCFVLVPTKPIHADEGMWLLNNLPLKQLQEKYGFVPSAEWVEKVQKSSARLPNCSSSFVSGDGLLMTNWHCAEEAVQSLSSAQRNLYKDGYYAPTYAEELKTGLNVRVLMQVGDKGVKVEGLTCENVPLYNGSSVQSYCYKVYNDIRLVFALERSVGFFGGDADNFEYPRTTLDVAFLRAYENGKPAQTPNHFTWSEAGPKFNELIFVSGHPGSTKRLLTSDALKTERDVRVPFLLDLFRRREITLQQYMLRGKEQHRIAESDLFSWQNSRKLYTGKIRGLQDPQLLQAKIDFEKKVLAEASPADAEKFREGLELVKDAQIKIVPSYPGWVLLARGLGFDSQVFEQNSQAGLNLEYEEYKLRDSLTHLFEDLRVGIVYGDRDDSTALAILRWGHSPSDLAHKLVNDPTLRAEFVKSIKDAVKEEDKYMTEAFKDEKEGYDKINEFLFRLYGTNVYPDATFTLRLSFGKVSGYDENGASVSPFTTIGDAYKHSLNFDKVGDYKLPDRWWSRKSFVRSKTPLDFISNLDITGGNSGSPVFNKDLEIVGLVFDGNLQGLVSDYDFSYNPNARAISVHSSGIIEILSKIYRADRLVKELTQH